jgi:hypothetical protein
LKFLNKVSVLQILKRIIDIMLSTNLSDKCLENLAPLVLNLFNFVEISGDGKIVYDIVLILYDFSNNDTLIKLKYFKALITIFECIVSSESIIEVNSMINIKLLLTSTKSLLFSVIESIKQVDIINNLENLIKS